MKALRWLIVSGALFAAAASPRVASAAGSVAPLTLAEVVALATANNPTVEQIVAQLDAARADLAVARAVANPEFEWRETRLDEAPPGEDASSREFGIVQPVELWGKRRARIAAANAALSAAEFAATAGQRELVAGVTSSYINVLSAQRALSLSEAALAGQRGIEEIAVQRVNAGEAPEIDRIRARTETLRAMRGAQDCQLDLFRAREELMTLCGRQLPSDFILADILADPLPPWTGADQREQMLEGNPELLQAGAVTEFNARAVRAEARAWWPDVHIGLGMEQASGERSWNAAIGIALPFWQRNQGGVMASNAAWRSARAEETRLRQQLAAELSIRTQEYETARLQAEAFVDVLQSAAEALRIETLLYREGEADFIALLEAQRAARDTEQEYLETLRTAHTARAELTRITGTGGVAQ